MEEAFQIIAAWFVADLITGIYHKLVDQVLPSWTPVIGSQVIEFNEHHLDANAFLVNSFWSSFWRPLVAALPLFALAYCAPWFFIPLGLGVAFSQTAHKWAHMPVRPAWVVVAQGLGLLISPVQHGIHHVHFDRAYGILNGWSNGLLDLLLGVPRHRAADETT